MTQRDALAVVIRGIGIYWLATALFDFFLALMRLSGVALGPTSTWQKDIAFAVAAGGVGLFLLLSTNDLLRKIFKTPLSDTRYLDVGVDNK